MASGHGKKPPDPRKVPQQHGRKPPSPVKAKKQHGTKPPAPQPRSGKSFWSILRGK